MSESELISFVQQQLNADEAVGAEPCMTRSIRAHLLYTIEHYAYHAGQIALLAKFLESRANVPEVQP